MFGFLSWALANEVIAQSSAITDASGFIGFIDFAGVIGWLVFMAVADSTGRVGGSLTTGRR